MAINKDLAPLTKGERQQVKRAVEGNMVIDSLLAGKLLNDLEREELKAATYYGGLGPADGDFRYDAARKCYSRRLLVELGEE